MSFQNDRLHSSKSNLKPKKTLAVFLYHPTVEIKGRQSVKPHHGKFLDEIAHLFGRVYLIAPYWYENQLPAWMQKHGLMYNYILRSSEVYIVKGLSSKASYPFRFFQQLYYFLKSDEVLFFTPALAPIVFGILANIVGKPYYAYVAIDLEAFFAERFRSKWIGILLGGLLAWVIGRSRGVLATGSGNLTRFQTKTRTLRVSPLLSFDPVILQKKPNPLKQLSHEEKTISDSAFGNESEQVVENTNKIILLYIGPIVPRKNLHSLIEAVTQTVNLASDSDQGKKQRKEEYFLNVVGNISDEHSDYGNQCLKDLKELEKSGNAKYWGYVRDTDLLQEIIESSHYLVLPSESEGFPKVVYEAMAGKCVPILTRLPSYSDFIVENQNAIFMNGSTAQDILLALRQVDESLWGQIADNNTELLERVLKESTAKQFSTLRKKKLAYLSTSTIPSLAANSVHVMKMAQALTQENYEVTLYAPLINLSQINATKHEASIWSHYGIRQKFSLKLLLSLPKLKLFDYSVLSVIWAKWIQPVDLVWTRSFPIALVSVVLGVPVILEMHRPLKSKGWIRKKLLRHCIASSNLIRLVVISEALRERYLDIFKKLGQRSNIYKIFVSHDGVDLEAFDHAKPLSSIQHGDDAPLGKSRLRVGYSGHLYAGRGIELLLEVALALPEVDFVFLGGRSSDVKKYQELARNKKIKNAFFMGFLPNAELPSALKAMDILVMPYQKELSVSGQKSEFSNTSSWMSPMKLFEYLACERAIVSSDLPVLREILDESCAVFCDPESKEQWIEAIQKLATDLTERNRIAVNAYAKVKHFTWRNRVRDVLQDV